MRLDPGTSVVVYNDATYEIVQDGRGVFDGSRIEDEGYPKVIEGWVFSPFPKYIWFEPGMIRCREPGNHRVLVARQRV